jgi:hypothetical protein
MKTLVHARDRTELVRRLRTLNAQSPRQWGQMSVHQMVCHLADACEMATGDKRVTSAATRLPPVVMKWIGLYLPLRWPPGIETRPEIDQRCGGTKPGDFTADLARVEVLLDRMAALDQDSAWPTHPVFGRMSRSEWLRWGYLHTDHHLRQFGA